MGRNWRHMRTVRAPSGNSLAARCLATVSPPMMLLYLFATELRAAPCTCMQALGLQACSLFCSYTLGNLWSVWDLLATKLVCSIAFQDAEAICISAAWLVRHCMGRERPSHLRLQESKGPNWGDL